MVQYTNTLSSLKNYLKNEEVGIFICKCGLNIAGVVNVHNLENSAKNWGAYTKVIDYACSESGQEEILECIKENNLKGIVIAACSPKLHENTFRKLASKAGMNPYRVAIANIREQCTWVHKKSQKTQIKAEDIIRMAFFRIKFSRDLEKRKFKGIKKVVIIGGGIAGIEASLLLANSGFDVILVEKKPSIGGHMALLNEIFPNNDCSICVLAPKMNEVWDHEKITVYTNSEVTEISGTTGKFKIKIKKYPRFITEECKGCIEDCSSVCPITVYDCGFRKAIYMPFPQSTPLYAAIDWENCIRCDLCIKACKPNAIDFSQKIEEFEVDAGAIIIATGYKLFNPEKTPEYGYHNKNVITSLELERILSPSGMNVKLPNKGKIAFIQCVGSRDLRFNSYCSRVCCMMSIKNALILKERFGLDVTIFYTDIRASGRGYEEYYKKAIEKGIRFIRAKPIILESNEKIKLQYEDTLLSKSFVEEYDIVVLAVGMEPSCPEWASKGKDGFVEVLHPKLRPVETSTKGIFVAGCASGPKDIAETVFSAGLAASKVIELLSEEIEVEPFYAFVNIEMCNGCGLCKDVCPSNAVTIESIKNQNRVKRFAKIDSDACMMCGLCVSACPNEAIDIRYYSKRELTAEIESLKHSKANKIVIIFACDYCSYSALDLAGALRLTYPEEVRVIRVPCSARVSPELIFKAMEVADGIIVAGCRIGECHFGVNEFAKRRVDVLSKIFEDKFNIKSIWCSAGEAEKIVYEIKNFVRDIK